MLPLPSTFKDRQKDTLHGYCRVCHAEWNRQHYLRNKAAYVATARRTNPKYVMARTPAAQWSSCLLTPASTVWRA
jgi:hypothetical protein